MLYSKPALKIRNIVNKLCFTLFCHLASPLQRKTLWACYIVRRGLKRTIFLDICHSGTGVSPANIHFWHSIFLHCTIYKYYWIAKTYFAQKTALGVLAICCRDAGIKSPPLWIMRKPNRSLRICHTILDSLNMTDLRQIVTFEGDWRKTNKVNQAGLTVSDGSFRCGGFVMQYRVDISTSDHFWTHSLSFLCQVRQGTFSPTS